MASTKEIRTRMKSVEQTLKITNAMYLIASSNLRKAKARLEQAAPYFTKMHTTIADILHRSPALSHHFLDRPPQAVRGGPGGPGLLPGAEHPL